MYGNEAKQNWMAEQLLKMWKKNQEKQTETGNWEELKKEIERKMGL